MNNHGWASRRGGGERPGVRRTRACTTNREVRHVQHTCGDVLHGPPTHGHVPAPRQGGLAHQYVRQSLGTPPGYPSTTCHDRCQVGCLAPPIWFAMGRRAQPPCPAGDLWPRASARFPPGTWHGWRVDLGPWAELYCTVRNFQDLKDTHTQTSP